MVFNKFIPYRESRVIELIVDTFDFAFAFIVLLTIKNILNNKYNYHAVDKVIYIRLFLFCMFYVISLLEFQSDKLKYLLSLTFYIVTLYYAFLILKIKESGVVFLRYYSYITLLKCILFITLIWWQYAFYFDVASNIMLFIFLYKTSVAKQKDGDGSLFQTA